MKRDFPESLSAIHYAIERNHIDLLRILLNDFKEPKKNRCHLPEVIMEEQFFGAHAKTEDNNALLKVNDGLLISIDV